MPYEPETPRRPALAPEPSAPKPLTGRGVLLSLGLFFGAVMVANAALTYSALRSLPGGELANSYDASQNYNMRIAEARAQDERGWQARLSVRTEDGGVRIGLLLTDRDGAPVSGLKALARFEHPADKRADREAPLAARESVYEGLVPSLHPGRWSLVIEAAEGGERVYVSRNLIKLTNSSISVD